jgi:mRNA-degrading endonuclease RelE of RelBE toxin-antitoxin system
MRIIAEFDKEDIKVTVFKMNDRISIKFEKDLIEIIHKFRDGAGIDSAESAVSYCSDQLVSDIQRSLALLAKTRSEQLEKQFFKDQDNIFPNVVI